MSSLPKLDTGPEARQLLRTLQSRPAVASRLSEFFYLIDKQFSDMLRTCEQQDLPVTQGQAILSRQLAELFEVKERTQ